MPAVRAAPYAPVKEHIQEPPVSARKLLTKGNIWSIIPEEWALPPKSECQVINMETQRPSTPLFSNRALVNLTVPIALNSLMAIFMGMADSIMVSSAGAAAVSAVSLVDALNNVFTTAFDAIPIGGSVVTSQYIGARQYEKAKASVCQILYSGFTIAVICMTLLLCFRKQVLNLIYGTIEQDVFDNAVTYFTLTLISFPFLVIGCTSTATLRAMAKSRQAVTITITVNFLNVIGNAILIYGFKIGVAGAAISTTLARIVWCVWGVLAMQSKKLPMQVDKIFPIRLDWDIMKRVLRVGSANGFENALFYVGRLLVSSLVASLGTVYIAAYSLASNLNNFGWTMTGAFTTSSMTVVGQCVGAGEKAQARQNAKKLLMAATVTMVISFSLVAIFSHQLVSLYDLTPEELDVAAYHTRFAAILTIFTGYSLSFVPMGSFRAAGDIRYPMVVTIATMFIFRVAFSYLLCYGFHLGLMSVWIGMAADWVCRTVLNSVHFIRGKWLDKKLI